MGRQSQQVGERLKFKRFEEHIFRTCLQLKPLAGLLYGKEGELPSASLPAAGPPQPPEVISVNKRTALPSLPVTMLLCPYL